MEVFTQDIEKVILENFDKAKKSIIIVVAWFTNKKIIEKLIELKKYKNLDIQILVDGNEVNQKYFYQLYLSDLEEKGIAVKRPLFSKFNHNKFAIIDNEIFITGSYNFTNKANKNFENIAVKEDARIADFYSRVFRFFTEDNYKDSNVQILYENFEFANKLISTYYPFSLKLFSKLKKQINLGYCFTHENGLYNEISYEPGLIFNPKFKFHKQLKAANIRKDVNRFDLQHFDSILTQEFELPITKELIRDFRLKEVNDFNYQTMQEIAHFDNKKIDYEELHESFESNEIALKEYYTRKFKTIYTPEELREVLARNVDIIIEDYIWINNFAPFLTESIIEMIYKAADNHC